MTITEKVSYLKGLAEGLGLDTNTKEGKILKALIDVVDDMALTVADLEDECAVLTEHVDLIDEDLESLEEDFYEEYDDEDQDEDFEEDLIKVECPSCGDTIYIDDAILDDGELDCPNCGEKLEFDLSCECGCEDDCDCDCDSDD